MPTRLPEHAPNHDTHQPEYFPVEHAAGIHVLFWHSLSPHLRKTATYTQRQLEGEAAEGTWGHLWLGLWLSWDLGQRAKGTGDS